MKIGQTVVICCLCLLSVFADENGLECKDDIFENIFVKRVVNDEELGAAKVNGSELDEETVLEVFHGDVPILCPGNLQIRKLSYLKMANVKMQELRPGSFDDLPELKEINFKYNRLTEIKNGIFNGTDMVVINLEGNKIQVVEEDAFDDMPYLMSVDFDLNHITELNPNWFKNSPNIRYITFNFNHIKTIPENAFKYIFEYDGLSIYLIYNEIETIESNAFGNFRNFGNFILDHNKLEALPMDLFPKTDHSFGLSLHSNQFMCIDDRLLHNLASSCRFLDFSNNPFSEKCLEEVKLYADEYKQEMEIKY